MRVVVLKEIKDSICTLTINRPEKRNALNREVLLALGDAISELQDGRQCRVLIIRGAGTDSFSAGGDLTEAVTGKNMRQLIKALEYFQQSLINFPFPVIAMIYGATIGAGVDTVTMCDIRLAAGNAFFSVNPVKLGRVYYYTSALRLVNLIGFGTAAELLLTGGKIDAARAEKINLVNKVFPVGQLEQKTYEIAAEIAEENDPLAVRNTKLMLRKLAQISTNNIASEVKQELHEISTRVTAKSGDQGVFT